MKPSWDDAPEGANWVAQDEDGSWWWYGEEPSPCYGPEGEAVGFWVNRLRCWDAGWDDPSPTWDETVEPRP